MPKYSTLCPAVTRVKKRTVLIDGAQVELLPRQFKVGQLVETFANRQEALIPGTTVATEHLYISEIAEWLPVQLFEDVIPYAGGGSA